MIINLPKLNDSQLKQLAEFTSNLSLVFFAAGIAPIFTNIDRVNIFSVILGLTASIIVLIISLLLIKKG